MTKKMENISEVFHLKSRTFQFWGWITKKKNKTKNKNKNKTQKQNKTNKQTEF